MPKKIRFTETQEYEDVLLANKKIAELEDEVQCKYDKIREELWEKIEKEYMSQRIKLDANLKEKRAIASRLLKSYKKCKHSLRYSKNGLIVECKECGTRWSTGDTINF